MNDDRRRIIIYNSIGLFIMCINIIVFFTFVYILLDVFDLGIIIDHHDAYSKMPLWADHASRTLYFSAITLLSVGYGDISPFGLSRGVATIEAIIGYILPAVITVQYISLFPFKNKK
ncbi:two pore domain potassium channel family protein [Terrilactibacillus sp. BCM23-1]|uniref:Two pore domain potassium channel family protein n=1 Tax=Terrilactibacillus tamarindi TaxID=2599694 RepID=A0A6N8CTZ0_9BACI|nr:ion channel [Terrilactibacillus tamarindi]MTT31496.1 two pore domain potassium channel family protein [Terrilactibacillus tamarindi]